MALPNTTVWGSPMNLGPLANVSSSGVSNISNAVYNPGTDKTAHHLTTPSIPDFTPTLTPSGVDASDDINDEMFLSCMKASDVRTAVDCGLIPALSLLGVVGNCLCVVIFLRQRYHSSAQPLLLAFCVSAVLFLLCSFVVSLPCIVRKVNQHSGHVMRVSLAPQVNVLREMMGRVTVVMTLAIGVERSVAVTRPLKLRALCTVPRTRTVVLLVFFCVFALQAPAFFCYDVTYHVIPHNVTRLELRRTSFYLDNKHVLDFYVDYFLLVMLRALPFASTCVCFGIVLVSLKRRLQYACPRTPKFGAFSRAKGTGPRQTTDTDHGDLVLEERKLTRALLAVLLLCLVCELPGLVTRVYHVIRPDIRSSAFLVSCDVSRLICVMYSAIIFMVFMRLYKHFSVTCKTLVGLCN